eukprot:12336954-Alexandrium_andersonii.AAC.1
MLSRARSLSHPPWVILEGRVLVPVDSGLTQTIPAHAVRRPLVEPQQAENVGGVGPAVAWG